MPPIWNQFSQRNAHSRFHVAPPLPTPQHPMHQRMDWFERLDGAGLGQFPPFFGAEDTKPTGGAVVWGLLSTASMAASIYHGYKRNDSVGWALGWGLLGGLFPVIVPTIAVAQGFGKRKR